MNNSTFSSLFLLFFMLGSPSFSFGQDAPLPSPPSPYNAPSHMWELGFHGGVPLTFGDIDFEANWGAGFHIRRAIDYIFSLRAEALYAVPKNNDLVNGITETKFYSGSLELLMTLNNMKWKAGKDRKTNLYLLGGVGVNHFSVDVIQALNSDVRNLDGKTQTHANFGAGIAFRLSDKFNLGFETKGITVFGKRYDQLDGTARNNGDVLSYSSIRLNLNLGNSESKTEPLYWVSPLDGIQEDITELKKRPVFDPSDKDGDGVIDALDQDPETPPGVAVDTHGKVLDSDGDGIPNFEDDDPFMPVGKKAVLQGDRPFVTDEEAQELVRKELDNYASVGLYGSGNIANWFLPIINFNIDSDVIRYADYGNLANIARVLKGNQNLRVVVTGFTDKTASQDYNLKLSYKRAMAAIDHLVEIHGIARSRLVLNYNGEEDPLVPSTGSTIMNRRVEFRVATPEDKDMEEPRPMTGRSKRGY